MGFLWVFRYRLDVNSFEWNFNPKILFNTILWPQIHSVYFIILRYLLSTLLHLLFLSFAFWNWVRNWTVLFNFKRNSKGKRQCLRKILWNGSRWRSFLQAEGSRKPEKNVFCTNWCQHIKKMPVYGGAHNKKKPLQSHETPWPMLPSTKIQFKRLKRLPSWNQLSFWYTSTDQVLVPNKIQILVARNFIWLVA